jgi:hypothetical protein
MILELIDEAVASGARLHKTAEIVGLSARTVITQIPMKIVAQGRRKYLVTN